MLGIDGILVFELPLDTASEGCTVLGTTGDDVITVEIRWLEVDPNKDL